MTDTKSFDIKSALEAAKSAPVKAAGSRGSGALSEFSAAIMALFNEAGCPLSVNQVKAGLAAMGMEKTTKNICDRLWTLAKSGALRKTDTNGIYELNN